MKEKTASTLINCGLAAFALIFFGCMVYIGVMVFTNEGPILARSLPKLLAILVNVSVIGMTSMLFVKCIHSVNNVAEHLSDGGDKDENKDL